MWQEYAEALFYGLALSGLAFGVVRVFLFLAERSMEAKAGRVGLRAMLINRAKLEMGLETRRNKRVEELKAAEREFKEVFLQRQRLERQLLDARAASERTIRLIGEEVEGTPCFIVKVVNKYVGNSNPQRGPILVDRTWAQPQEMEVWTRSVAEARAEVERRYPPAFGFHITRLNELGADESTPAAKAS